ncbi:pectin lyase fold/virulence factor [Phialemonium atrogriseum]|uniref:pectinesterase n=1 Tax=Phialemonium atrogriseum TaxID=1093897 RepID=A0AAJ0BT88_9PEZI|nr:pectin lyase fold/virulence factor [Phialemonium atrogriseum]KAK1761616.1 pectin lyase fold/virulence factor [Phialemonium atrogriseum]
MKGFIIASTFLSVVGGVLGGVVSRSQDGKVLISPANGAKNVNPDTHLVLEFSSPPAIGDSGMIRIYDAADQKLVDQLDLSVPFSPSPYGNGSTKAPTGDKTVYQTNIIGGMDFYFFPIIVRENTATVYLHNNKLAYGRTYIVKMDATVLKPDEGTFDGFCSWVFSTKDQGPKPGTTEVVVAADGSGDFNTVQGAIDWAPANPTKRTNILIKDGNYEELVYFRYKTNLTIRGQSRNKTIVGYPNNSAFNPPGREGPSRRPAFSFHGVSDVQLSTFTINNYYSGQAEALLVEGVRVLLDRLTLVGSGDAFTTYGTIYVADSKLTGDGDTVLGYGSVYWLRSEIVSKRGSVTWTRTAQGDHGNVFVDSTISGGEGSKVTFARLPDNSGGVMDNWPFAEMVLIDTRTANVSPQGWGPVQGLPFDSSQVRFWEFNTMDLEGNPVDMSQRLNVSRQLTLPADADIIAKYRDPAYVLGGWTPVVLS